MTNLLKKGDNLSLEKIAPKLSKVQIGLRWDREPIQINHDFDLDLSLFLLGRNKKLISKKHLIFYNNLNSPDLAKSIQLMGDNRTGAGEGDDEVIQINFSKIESNVARMALCVTIHEAEQRQQDFGQISNAYLRLIDFKSQDEILRYDLADEFSLESGIIIAEFYRENGWNFTALGTPYQGGLAALIKYYQ